MRAILHLRSRGALRILGCLQLTHEKRDVGMMDLGTQSQHAVDTLRDVVGAMNGTVN